MTDKQFTEVELLIKALKEQTDNSRLKAIWEQVNAIAVSVAETKTEIKAINARLKKVENKSEQNGYCRGHETTCMQREDSKFDEAKSMVEEVKKDLKKDMDTYANSTDNIINTNFKWGKILIATLTGLTLLLLKYAFTMNDQIAILLHKIGGE